MATPIPSQEIVFSNNASIIYSIVSGLVGVILFLIWRRMEELTKDTKTGIADLYSLHRTCKDEMKRDFVSHAELGFLKEQVGEVKEDRRAKWKAFFAHKHSQSGRVEID